MKIYGEETKEEISDPDLSLGCLYKGTIVVGHVEERTEVMEGTVTEEYPEGWNKVIPAHDVVEECMWYRKYTDEELAQQSGGNIDKKISDAVTAAVMLAQGGVV